MEIALIIVSLIVVCFITIKIMKNRRLAKLRNQVILTKAICIVYSVFWFCIWFHPILSCVLIGIVIFAFLCGFLFLHFRSESKHKAVIQKSLYVAIKTFTFYWVIPILVLILAALALEVLEIRVKFLMLYLMSFWGIYTLIYFVFSLVIDLPKRNFIKSILLLCFFGVPIVFNLILGRSEERFAMLFPVCYCALYFIVRSVFNKQKKVAC
jgi:hypothetical protein